MMVPVPEPMAVPIGELSVTAIPVSVSPQGLVPSNVTDWPLEMLKVEEVFQYSGLAEIDQVVLQSEGELRVQIHKLD